MDNKEYIKLALRTESRVDSVSANLEALVLALDCFTVSGEILDGFKKAIYYNNPKKLNENLESLADSLEHHARELRKQAKTATTNIDTTNINPRVFHGIVGIATESAELVEALINYIDTGVLDTVNLQEEMGDGAGGTNSWYAAILHDELKLDPAVTMRKNIDKLRARYPEKYEDALAETRNLEVERKILEQ